MDRVASARWAWALSLTIHVGAIGGLFLSWREAPIAISAMEVGSVEFDARTPPNVTLSAAPPQPMTAVTAMPLAEPTSTEMFEPIVRVQATEAGPATTTSLPTQPVQPTQAPKSALPPGVATIFFGVPASGASVVYVIDRSASMGLEGRLQRATREVAMSLSQLPSSSRTQVIVYSRTAEPLCPGLVAADPAIIAIASERLQHLTAEGGTAHVRALKSALLLNPDVIYFLTDEDDLTPADVKTITDYNRGRTVIHTICLIDPETNQTPIGELAKKNRGQFRVAR